MSSVRPVLVALLLVLSGGAVACGDDATGADGAEVVVTTSILGDVVASLVGDDVTVEVLIPAGADPHETAPSARQAADLRAASLVVTNGLGLEAGLADALTAAADEGVTVLHVGELVDPLPFGSAHVHDDEAHDDEESHEHDDEDPHFWHDPLRMAQAVPALVEALVDAGVARDEAAVRERGEALVDELEALDREIEEILDVVPEDRRYLLTNHDTLGYFAARYDFEVIGVAVPGGDTLARPSAREISALVDELDAHDLPAIFAENVSDESLVRTIARESGRDVEVVALYSDALGPPDSGAGTYTGMLRTNAELVASALG